MLDLASLYTKGIKTAKGVKYVQVSFTLILHSTVFVMVDG